MAADSVEKVIAEMGARAAAARGNTINDNYEAGRLKKWADRLRALSPVLTAEELEALKAVESWLDRRSPGNPRYSEQATATICATIRRLVPGVTP